MARKLDGVLTLGSIVFQKFRDAVRWRAISGGDPPQIASMRL